MTSLDLSYKEIYPRIFVYRGLLTNKGHIHSILQQSLSSSGGKYYFGEWRDWYGFGQLCEPKAYNPLCTDFEHYMYENERVVEEQIQNAISCAFAHYIAVNNVEVPDNSIISRASFAAYYEGIETGGGNVMQYHTDYIVSQHFSRFENFLLTCTIYINDDYEGGEIRFTSMNGEFLDYKPEAGDVVVFPSGSPIYPGREPYFHAVRAVERGTKFLIRSFVKYQSAGSEEWLSNELLYGSEKWRQIEEDRVLSNSGRVSNQLQIVDGVKHYSQYLIDAFGFTDDDKERLGYQVGGFYED
jgi:predicted 2-oxoglutarate/Fe(II)-dependent dioxygenase YbiX